MFILNSNGVIFNDVRAEAQVDQVNSKLQWSNLQCLGRDILELKHVF